MTKDQQVNLFHSAAHWLDNWEHPESARIDGLSCACCQAFKFCRGCPVAEYTGRTGCEGTPYNHANRINRVGTTNEKKIAFEAEYRFLMALALGDTP